jgi:23S rRNA pseudouridine1911/1915/1917 synthase
LLEVHPLTGRTHQIRVHMAFLECPVAGDRIYGKHKSTIDLNRHFLHAYKLKIVLPGRKEANVFEAGLPPELKHVLDGLRNKG